MSKITEDLGKPVYPPPTYHLELSQEEAQSLRDILSGALSTIVIDKLGLHELENQLFYLFKKKHKFRRIAQI